MSVPVAEGLSRAGDIREGFPAIRETWAPSADRRTTTSPSDHVERMQKIMSRDWAVVAWPERAPGSPVLTDPFEGLLRGRALKPGPS
jgi:hypothetical protein